MDKNNNNISGNAYVYVLLALVLLASLAFAISDGSETGKRKLMSDQEIKIAATDLLAYATEAKNVISQLKQVGINEDEITFYTYDDSEFSSGSEPYIYMLYHPSGGGLNQQHIPDSIAQDSTSAESDEDPDWYIGRYNSIEWTDSTDDDVVAVAYKIDEDVCAKINDLLWGDDTIPALDGEAREFFIGTTELTCTNCDDKADLCVSDSSGEVFAYYSILANL